MTLDPELKEQLNTISSTLSQLTKLSDVVETQGKNIGELTKAVGEIQAERQTIQASATAQAEAERQKARDAELATAIQASVTEALAKLINPSGQPPRKTVPLAAQAQPGSDGINNANVQKHMELAAARGEFKALSENLHSDPSDMIRVQERIHQLTIELQSA